MEQIATECGITKPVIYRHFGDRNGLLLEMAGAFVDQLGVELLPLAAEQTSTQELLRGTIDTYLALVERDANLYRFLSANRAGDHRDLLAALIAEEVAIVIDQRLEAAGLDRRAAHPFAYGLVGMVHFAGDWWSEQATVTRAELLDQLMTLAWDGLGALRLDERAEAAADPGDPDRPGDAADPRP